MKFTINKATLGQKDGVYGIFIEVPLSLFDKLKKLIDKEGDKTVSIKQKSKARSLSANAYHWVLVGKLANLLTIPKGDLYVKMIKRYGQYTNVAVQADILQDFIRKWNLANTEVEHVESLCEVTDSFMKDRIKYVELNCHFGSSSYNSKDFSLLLNGIISECSVMDIETLKPNEIQSMMEGYEEK